MVVGKSLCLASAYTWNPNSAGVKKRVVGYPTPPPDADTEEDYLNNLQPEIVIIQQV